MYPGGAGLVAGSRQPLRLFGKVQLLGQVVQALLAVVAGGQTILHLHQRAVELLAKLRFGDLVIELGAGDGEPGLVVLEEGQRQRGAQGAHRVLQHLGQGVRAAVGAAGQLQCGVETGADLVPLRQGLAQAQLGGTHVGTPRQHVGRNADRQGGDGGRRQRLGLERQRTAAATEQQAQGIAGLLLLHQKRAELRLLAGLLLAGLHQIEPGHGAGPVLGLGQLLGALIVGELLLAQGNGRAEVGQLPILLERLADQHQAGGGQILGGRLGLPARLIPHRGEPAPQIHLVAEGQGGAHAAAGLAALQILGAIAAEAGIERGSQVGVGQIGTEQGAAQAQAGDLHVRVGSQHGLDQPIELGIVEALPPGAGQLAGETVVRLLPVVGQRQLLPLIAALLAAGAEAERQGEAEPQFG